MPDATTRPAPTPARESAKLYVRRLKTAVSGAAALAESKGLTTAYGDEISYLAFVAAQAMKALDSMEMARALSAAEALRQRIASTPARE